MMCTFVPWQVPLADMEHPDIVAAKEGDGKHAEIKGKLLVLAVGNARQVCATGSCPPGHCRCCMALVIPGSTVAAGCAH